MNDLVKTVLRERDIEFTKTKLAEIVDDIFGISCDSIDGKPMDTSLKDERCFQCGSTEFESNLFEPEQLTDIEVPVVTHELWKRLSGKEKRKTIERQLQKRKYI